MKKEISDNEAVKVIEEWGVDCDNFVAHKCKQFMTGGEPNDNSIELGDYFLGCLRVVCGIGIKAHNNTIHVDRDPGFLISGDQIYDFTR